MRALALCALLTTAATAASAFTAVNGEQVTRTSVRSQFDVISRPGAGPSQIWCAAAQYADAVLGARGNTRVYLVSPTQRRAEYRNARATRFTIKPDSTLANGPRPGEGGNYSNSLKKPGYNLRVAHAELFCETILQELLD